jgi:predicted Holliday junction resolvase-like endonuclease
MIAPYIIFVGLLYLYHRFSPSKKTQPTLVNTDNAHVHVALKQLERSLDEMPNKMLQTIIGSTNTHKGALGELIGYVQLRASYDRIIPLGNIVDFVAIRFPDGEQPGHIDFIDIKTGEKSRLSKDQRNLQKLIDEKRINFIKLKVETSNENQPESNQGGV